MDFQIGPTLGSMEIGTLLSSVLYGIVMVQVYAYFQASFTKDSILLKGIVVLLGLLETIHSIILWVLLYSKSVTNFGFKDKIVDSNAIVALVWPLSGIVTCIVQVFFAYRVHRMTLSYVYIAIFIPVSLLRLGFAIGIGVLAHTGDIFELLVKFQWLGIVELIGGALVDISNTIALCIHLERNQNILASFKAAKTMKTTDKLIIWIVETGMITSTYAIIQIILVLTSKKALFWMIFFFQSTKLYSSALLASLNGRISLKSAQAANHITPATLGPRAIVTDNSDVQVHIEMERRLEEYSHEDSGQKVIL